MIEKKIFLAGCMFPAVFALSSCQSGNENKICEQPNILFILADDMGYGELSSFNASTPVATPNIDRIAQAGVKMTQAYASPVSSPTRSCFLTGCFPQNVGVFGNHDGAHPGISPLRHCFAEELLAEGYQTAWFGKWHQGWDVSNHPANNGFERAFGFLGGMHDYYDPSEGDHYVGGPFAKHAWVFDQFTPVKEMSYFTEELTDQFLDFVDKADRSKPFFTYLAYNAPHTPLQCPEQYVKKYLEKGFNPVRATRLAMIEVLDIQVGRILDKLKAENLDENTLVVFMTDNGPESEDMSGGLRGKKMTVWEGGIRVPLVACLPNLIPAGVESDAICSIADMAATFIGLAKNQTDYSYGDGHSLIPYFNGKLGNVHDQLVFSIHLSGTLDSIPEPEKLDLCGVRDGDWKLVYDRKREVDALYNLKIDLSESTDLSEEYPEIKHRLWELGREFLHASKPACGKIVSRDTRKGGDKIKIDSLMNVYKEYVKDYKFTSYQNM